MTIPSPLRRLVLQRAGNRCEYCGLSQKGQEAQFHIDHVVPVSAKGPTDEENLALACVSCSLRKGARQFLIDPVSGESVVVFNPRKDLWHEHFRWDGVRVVPRTVKGRALVDALQLNRPLICAIRQEEAFRGRRPPPAR